MEKKDITNEYSYNALLEKTIRKNWLMPAFSDYNGATYHYNDVAQLIAKYHILMEQSGIKKGDKIAIVGKNSSAWAIAFFGTLAYGAVIVPILHEFKPDNIHHIVNHSEAKLLLADSSIWENLNEEKMPDLLAVMHLKDMEILTSKSKALSKAREHINELFGKKYPKAFERAHVVYHKDQTEELAILNYTSGTTSFSKGVMLPYRSVWSNVKFAADNLKFLKPGDNIVCMLPMAHMYGLAFEILNSFNIGCHVHFLTRTPTPKIIGDAFAAIKPRLILAVPLIIEKIVKNRVFPELEKPLLKLLLKIPFVDSQILKVISNKLNTSFGSEFEEIIIGGAALNKEVESFLRSINFRYTVGYGMTECGPLVSYAYWDSYRQGSCGRAVDRMEVRIDSKDPINEIGEIQVKGANTMLGYYKNDDATRNIWTKDNWLRTGDLGTIDAEGNIYIKGRSKSMILGPSGQNIYPEEIEDQLNNMLYVGESLIIEQAGKLVALVYPDLDTIDKRGISHADAQRQIYENIKELNVSLPKYSQISGVKIHQEEFAKTPKRSIKRYLYQNTQGDIDKI